MGALGVAVCALAAHAADPKSGIKIDTLDGVQLDASLWPSDPQGNAKDKGATVLLLHDFDKSGGDSHKDNLDNLADMLSKRGFAVLSFDFRGYGKSKTVSKDTFWDPIKGPHNIQYVKGPADDPRPGTITYDYFHASEYCPYFVNDVAAAKSYLDRHTGEGGINSSNVILVGAGQGATVGAMWMASQWYLKRVGNQDRVTGKFTFDEPEGRDVAGAVWLSLSPKLGGHEMPSAVRNWLAVSDGEYNVRQGFLYGADDASAESFVKSAVREIGARYKQLNHKVKDDDFKDWLKWNAAVLPIEKTNVTGTKLLAVDGTADNIANFASDVVQKHGVIEPRNHTPQQFDTYLWTFPNIRKLDAKTPADEHIGIIPVKEFLASSGAGG
jgi:pimeloyl-ACP methyl ester carboxylesterase